MVDYSQNTNVLLYVYKEITHVYSTAEITVLIQVHLWSSKYTNVLLFLSHLSVPFTDQTKSASTPPSKELLLTLSVPWKKVVLATRTSLSLPYRYCRLSPYFPPYFPAISLTWLHRYYLNWTELDDDITEFNDELALTKNWVFTVVLLHYRHSIFLFNTVKLLWHNLYC